ncbi:hypothetical protein C8F01DRAFT_1340925 [Mycena amicta]|nr:hypothetical protein C8F01DRAFT_1340925 [Mycena amicta]
MPHSQPIAIVGISTSLPSGADATENLGHDAFFDFLLASGQSYETMPANRCDIDAILGEGVGHALVNKGSFLKHIDMFDHVEFGVSSRDARAMGPSTRILLEQVFLALLDSGIDYRNQPVGCFTAATVIDLSNSATPDLYETRGSFAAGPAMVANRVSLHLDLVGPSIPTDTACSSSHTAFHLAIQSLIAGDCNAAVVGACQLNQRLIDWIMYSQGGILSRDGKCKPFDASADGFGRAEGCAAVVLKTLDDAIRDNDHIYATVLGSATNSNGGGGPPNAPVARTQKQAMKSAFQRAGKAPSEASYAEIHATGTAKGDPTEANWVGEEFSRGRPAARELLIGSVKGNIGHTEITAFLASLSKVLSIFEHGIIPPNVNLHTLNPAIKWDEYKLRVPTATTPFPTHSHSGSKSIIAMSSSGIGGANGHVVLEAPPTPACTTPRPAGNHVILVAGGLSPRSAAVVADQTSELMSSISGTDALAVSTILGRRTRQMTWRSFALADTASPSATVKFSKPQFCGRDTNSLVFVFSGQGPQHEQMGRELFATFPVFRQSILELDNTFWHTTGKSMLYDYGLFKPAQCPAPFVFPAVWPISLTLPAIAMFQIAFFDLLVSLGVRPDAVLGHSAGETTVLYASGAASKAMALELAIIRGRVFADMENSGGTMAALSCSPKVAEEILTQQDTEAGVVDLACLNSPDAVAISGDERAINAILQRVEQLGILGRKIRTRVPIHSSMMELCRERYCAEVEGLFERYPGPHMPTTRTYSTLTGEQFAGPYTADYFWQNTRGQVLFTPAVQALADASTFIEISPHPVLSSYLSEMADPSSSVLSTVRRAKPGQPSAEHRDTLGFLGRLVCAGHNCVDFTALTGISPSTARQIKLPAYPFAKKSFPLYPSGNGNAERFNGPINRTNLRMNKDTHPLFAQHVIRGEVILPAAGFLEMALEFGATMLLEVNFRSILPLSSDNPLPVQVTLNGAHWKIATRVPSRSGSDSVERLHADGFLSFESPPPVEDLDIAAIRARCPLQVGDSDEFYSSLSYFDYGPKFQRVVYAYYNPDSDEALISVRGLDGSLEGDQPYIAHPAIIDACFQFGAYRPFHGNHAPNDYYLPGRIMEMILHLPSRERYFPAHVYVHMRLERWLPDAVQFKATITDTQGKVYCTLRLQTAKHHASAVPEITTPLHIVPHTLPTAHPDSLPLYNESEHFVFPYRLGEERKLQGRLAGLNPLQDLTIFITADEGADTAAGLGMARALRREYLGWDIKFVSLPRDLGPVEANRQLGALSSELQDEPDILLTSSGKVKVPRMMPLEMPLPHGAAISSQLNEGQLRIHIQESSVSAGFVSFVALVMSTGPCSSVKPSTYVVGLTSPRSEGPEIIVDATSVLALPAGCSPQIDALPGTLAAILALPSSQSKSAPLMVLITHSSTPIGAAVARVYSQIPGIHVIQSQDDESLLSLSRFGIGAIDLILSGHEQEKYIQILHLLLRPESGKLFLWHRELSRVVDENPLEGPSRRRRKQPLFSTDKAYLLLGGVGHIGAYVALYLVQNGVRNLIVTSRSGKAGLRHPSRLISRRIFDFLCSLPGITITFHAIDASSPDAMRGLFSTSIPIGGCVILSALLSDGLFSTLREDDFARVLFAKTGVLHAMQEAAPSTVATMDFVAAFSSVTVLVGTGGQTNYCIANGALEEAVGRLPNGFSFVCPGIIDSATFTSGGSTLRQLTDWSISTEEMILWFDDALRKFTAGPSFSFSRYIPNLDWGVTDRSIGMPKLGKHLILHATDTRDIELQAVEETPQSRAARIVQSILNVSALDFDADVPLTSYGIDSLSAGRLSFALRSIAQVTQLQLLADNSLSDILRKFPLASASEFVSPLNSESGSPKLGTSTPASESPAETMPSSGQTVLVTGTTGVLGTHILVELLARPDVSRVYALNRGTASLERQAAALEEQGFDPSLASSPKAFFVEGELEDKGLFSTSNISAELRASVTHIIHNAWRVDFMASFSEFSDLIRGTENLLEFAIGCNDRPTFSFISTIGVAHNLPSNIPALAEAPINDPEMAVANGYTESKWIAERFVQVCSENGYLNTNVIRTGLLTGSAVGVWHVSQWVPALVQSGMAIGCLPDGEDTVSWVAVETAAAGIVDMSGPAAMNATLHLIHPQPTQWNTLFRPISLALGVPLVPYPEWFARLRATAAFANSPALKLLDMFEYGIKPRGNFESMGLLPKVEASFILQGAVPSLEGETDKWVGYWRGIGFLSVA